MLFRTAESLPRAPVVALAAALMSFLCAATSPATLAALQGDSVPPEEPIPRAASAPPSHSLSHPPSSRLSVEDQWTVLKVRLDSQEDLRLLSRLGAKLYFKGDDCAVVRLDPKNLAALDSYGLQWRVLASGPAGRLYLLVPDDRPLSRHDLSIADLDVTPLDVMSDGTIVSASPEAAARAVELGYKAVPLDRAWPLPAGGYPDYEFIHDAVTPDASVLDVLGAVSQDSLTAYVRHLEDYGTRYVQSPQIVRAGGWLLNKLLSFGYTETTYQNVAPDGKVQLASANVIATKRGTMAPEFRVVVGGHYDSIVSSDQGSPMDAAPGADDNASGSAATLEIARILAAYDLDATVQFALFTAEETGLHGSIEMAGQFVSSGVLPENVFVLNMDMIANADAVPWEVLFYHDSLSMPLAGLASRITEAYSTLIPVMAGPSYRSDHFPFQQAGYPAIFVHEGGPHPNYHTVNDKLVNLEMDYATEVVRVALATVLHMARIASPPAAVEVSEAPSGGVLVRWSHSEDADVLGYYVELLDSDNVLLSRHFSKENRLALDASELAGAQWIRVRSEDVVGESVPSEPALVGNGRLLVAEAAPNPTTDRTRIDLFIPGSGEDVEAAVRIFDASGRLVDTVHEGPLPRGFSHFDWDNTYGASTRVSSGIYFYEVDVPGVGQRRGKIMVVR